MTLGLEHLFDNCFLQGCSRKKLRKVQRSGILIFKFPSKLNYIFYRKGLRPLATPLVYAVKNKLNF